ncbi:DUF4393 domain-containing protein [Undibacterium sp. FT147W]|uniref:DUF4393 domain-containing protein n=1 Tax=Undibacterium rivi TaxID=2828729 RepID=A0ABS5H3S5_9BURK|nr:Abi-alpha family protein [Undibacterium rivi]MBR7793451.1 DUF4393 domain-containing protein [Undibacterium rivi]
MSSDKKTTKFDLSSSALESGIDIAKSFVDKLVTPPIEELGLLVKDQISYWRFNNQIRILNKAKALCEKNKINIKSLPPKLLCPYLENASLEDDNDLQDKWAALLVNMVDSEQNIQNHVFPYILSQLSKDEFDLLESVLIEKKKRIFDLSKELSEFIETRSNIENSLKLKIEEQKAKLEKLSPDGKFVFSSEAMQTKSSIRSIETELRSLAYKELVLRRQISAPQSIPEQNIKEFEIANIIRLGLAKVVYEASAGTHSIDIPGDRESSYTSVDFDIEIETETSTILTELGELFIDACREKTA